MPSAPRGTASARATDPFVELSVAVQQGLSVEADWLRRFTLGDKGSAQADAARARLISNGRDRHRIDSTLMAYLTTGATVAGPSRGDIDAAKSAATKLTKLGALNVNIKSVMDLGARLGDLWNRTQATEGRPGVRRSAGGLPRKPWSFLAYIAGDNNLSDAGISDIEEMCAVGASPVAHAAVQIDTKGDFDGLVRYEISEPDPTGVSHRVVVKRIPEADSGAPETLEAFLRWGLDRYPAERRLVVVWNHGSGFRNPRTPRRDIAFDDSGTSLDMNEIDSVFDRVGIGPENRVDILGFDACLMNMVEIAHHLANRAKFIVGSEQTEPNQGWPYDRVLRLLNQDLPADAVAGRIVDEYIRSYQEVGERNVTQSAVDTDRLDPVILAMSVLGKALKRANRKQLSAVRSKVQSYEDFPDYVDLGHLCMLIESTVKDSASKPAASKVRKAAAAAVIRNGKLGEAVDGSHGLSCWYPPNATLLHTFRPKYAALKCCKLGPGWVEFLDWLHSV